MGSDVKLDRLFNLMLKEPHYKSEGHQGLSTHLSGCGVWRVVCGKEECGETGKMGSQKHSTVGV